MTDFGFDDPREMPRHFFDRSISVQYRTAVRADPEKQNRSICPRYRYLDVVYPCERCGEAFTFTVAELPARIHETRSRLARQMARAER